MPDSDISNPGGAYGYTATQSYSYIPLVNSSTSTIDKNDAVVLSSATNRGKVRESPTTLNNKLVIGVADENIAAGKVGRICVQGMHLVKVSTSAIPATGALLVTSTAAAGTVKTSTATTAGGIHLGVCMSSTLDTTDTDTVWAYISKS